MLTEVHDNRLKCIRNNDIRQWAKNLIAEWSRNDLTTMRIIELAVIYENLVEYQETFLKEDHYIETKTGGLKVHPAMRLYQDAQRRFATLAKQLDINPEDVIEGEGYE